MSLANFGLFIIILFSYNVGSLMALRVGMKLIQNQRGSL